MIAEVSAVVGGQVKAQREAAGMGRDRLAALIGAGVSDILDIESARRVASVATLMDIAAALGISVSRLFAASGVDDTGEGKSLPNGHKPERDDGLDLAKGGEAGTQTPGPSRANPAINENDLGYLSLGLLAVLDDSRAATEKDGCVVEHELRRSA